jgi:hypothetical protein
MNWRNILLLSLLSLPVTLASTWGFIPAAWVEMVVWLVIGLLIAWALRSGPRPFISGFICGMLMGVWSHLLGMALWDTYLAHNAETGAQIAAAAAEKNMSPQLFMLLSAPMIGVCYGLVLGLLTWAASKLPHRAVA